MANAKQASTMSAQGERINRVEAAVAGTAVVKQLQTSFPLGPNIPFSSVVNAALPLAPLLFFKPEKRETGVMSVVSNPKFWAPALVTGIVAAEQIQTHIFVTQTARFAIVRDYLPEMAIGRSMRLHVTNGFDVQKVKWESDNDPVATVDKNTGLVHAVHDGSATITAKLDGEEDSVIIWVL
jgi:hypothetical protein